MCTKRGGLSLWLACTESSHSWQHLLWEETIDPEHISQFFHLYNPGIVSEDVGPSLPYMNTLTEVFPLYEEDV